MVRRSVYRTRYTRAMGRRERRIVERLERIGKVRDGVEEVTDRRPRRIELPGPPKGLRIRTEPDPPSPAPAHDPQAHPAPPDPKGATALPPPADRSPAQVLGRLQRIGRQERRLAEEADALWISARELGISWTHLARATGLTRSGAQHRYRAALRSRTEGRSSGL